MQTPLHRLALSWTNRSPPDHLPSPPNPARCARAIADSAQSTRIVMSAKRAALAEDGLAAAERGQDPLGDGLSGEADLLAQEGRLAVGDIAVGEPDSQHPRPLRAVRERVLDVLEHARAETTG